MTYCIWIYAPPGNPHWQCFNEVADGIFHSLVKLGYGAYIYAGAVPPTFGEDRLIVFNAHTMPAEMQLPANAIVYNAEQIPAGSTAAPWWPTYLARMKRHRTWDYSATNCERLQKFHGITPTLCPIGYYEKLSRIHLSETPDIDVLFYGSMNTRRRFVLEKCKDFGLKVETVFGKYGEERDEYIARAKVVANVHFYQNPIWEIFRCSYLLGNRVCVVSEDGGTDADLEKLAQLATKCVSYDKIPEACKELVESTEARKAIEEVACDHFIERDQVHYVKAALKAS